MLKIHIPNFSLRQICDSGQCFRMKEETDGRYSLVAFDQFLRLEQNGEEVTFYCSQEEYDVIWKDYFDLNTNYDVYMHSIDVDDEYLKRAVAYGSGIRILKQEPWEMIISFIISQQNNIKRIRKCVETLCEKYGEEKQAEDGTVFFTFPTPKVLAKVSEEAFRACNLGYRSKYLVQTARMVAEGSIDLKKLKKLSYPQAKQELLKLSGVGSKVADCISLFSLHQLDAFPVDTHIIQVLEKHYPTGFQFEKYTGFSGVLQQYIFYYDLMGNKE